MQEWKVTTDLGELLKYAQFSEIVKLTAVKQMIHVLIGMMKEADPDVFEGGAFADLCEGWSEFDMTARMLHELWSYLLHEDHETELVEAFLDDYWGVPALPHHTGTGLYWPYREVVEAIATYVQTDVHISLTVEKLH